jgi:heme-degrading monooxygenase HmoA
MASDGYYLAQFNIARALAPLNDALLADFVAQIDAVNAEAEGSPGFIWRLKDEMGQSSSYIQAYSDPNMLINLTVWESVESLHAYTYRSGHAAVFRRRKEWFAPSEQAAVVLWWVPAGSLPTLEEARERLEYLWAHGPTARAFTFRHLFPAPQLA